MKEWKKNPRILVAVSNKINSTEFDALNATNCISKLTDFKIFQPDPPLKKEAGCPQVKPSPIFQPQEPLATEVIENPCEQLPVTYAGQPIKNLYCEPYEQDDLSYICLQNHFYAYITVSKTTGLGWPTVLIIERLVTYTIINYFHYLPMGQSWKYLLKVALIHVMEVIPSDGVFHLEVW